jgi:taurine dioxygenase
MTPDNQAVAVAALELTVTPLVGAVVGGVDLREVEEPAFAATHRAWLDHLVLLFRDHDLGDDELVAFSRRLGDLDLAPVQETGRHFVEGHPEIYIVSNVIENGVPVGSLGASELVWRTDMSYQEDPPKASILCALEVPPGGGNTGFVNMYRAYDELPAELKSRLAGVAPTDDPRDAPGLLRPLVCSHPETGRRCLYLGRRGNAYIAGLPLAESEALLDELWAQATRDELTWYNNWRVSDVVLWDNRCTMHRRDPFDPGARRVMHRTQIKGETGPAG